MDALLQLQTLATNLSSTCMDSLMNVSSCAVDNDPLNNIEYTSLSTTNGCCLSACAEAIDQVSVMELLAGRL